MSSLSESGASGRNKDLEFVKVIRDLYHEQIFEDPMKILNSNYIGGQRAHSTNISSSNIGNNYAGGLGTTNLVIQPPQNFIIPSETQNMSGDK